MTPAGFKTLGIAEGFTSYYDDLMLVRAGVIGEPAYFKHVSACAQLLFKRAGTTAEDYDYAVFHQPNGKFPVRAAKQLDLTYQS